MTLYIIGLGLWDAKDITVKGLEAVKNCDYVYLESYTSRLSCSIEDLEEFYGKKIIRADRDKVEKQADEMLERAKEKNVAFLVIGDPFCATTHIDFRLRAKEKDVDVVIINNASIINSIGVTGIDLYKIGRITSIPFDNEKVTSPLAVIEQNQELGMSTLVLFDLRPDEDRYMTVNQALEFLIRIGLPEDTLVVGCGGIGSPKPDIKKGTAKELLEKEFTLFPQCLIVPGKMHFMEEEALDKLF